MWAVHMGREWEGREKEINSKSRMDWRAGVAVRREFGYRVLSTCLCRLVRARLSSRMSAKFPRQWCNRPCADPRRHICVCPDNYELWSVLAEEEDVGVAAAYDTSSRKTAAHIPCWCCVR